MTRAAFAGLLAALALAGCARPLPPGEPRFLLGQPYTLGGVWSYPREAFAGTETGLASVLPDAARGRRTANGEVYDPARLTAAHRTLQLPAIVTVRNLETGRELRLRVNDRGPEPPGRLLGLSGRAAELLGVPPGGAAQIRVTVDEAASRALARGLPSAEPRAPVASAAPRATVEAEGLAPLPGAREATRLRSAPVGPTAVLVGDAAPDLPPDPLPESVAQYPATPGRLMIETGSFFRRDLAQRQAARIGAQVEPFGPPRAQQYRVRSGLYADVAAADRALAALLRAGLPDVTLLVVE